LVETAELGFSVATTDDLIEKMAEERWEQDDLCPLLYRCA